MGIVSERRPRYVPHWIKIVVDFTCLDLCCSLEHDLVDRPFEQAVVEAADMRHRPALLLQHIGQLAANFDFPKVCFQVQLE